MGKLRIDLGEPVPAPPPAPAAPPEPAQASPQARAAPDPGPPPPAARAVPAPSLDDAALAAKLAELAEGLPSPARARKEQLKRAPRLNWTFNNIPAPIKTAFEAEARARGMTMKAFFLHCLRAGGLDIPAYEDMDGRRR